MSISNRVPLDDNFIAVAVALTVVAGIAADLKFPGTALALGIIAFAFWVYIFMAGLLNYLGNHRIIE